MKVGLLCAERTLRQLAVGRLVPLPDFTLAWYIEVAAQLTRQLPVAALLVAPAQVNTELLDWARQAGVPLLAVVRSLTDDCDALYAALERGVAGYLELDALEGAALAQRLQQLLVRAVPAGMGLPLVAIGASAGGPQALRTLLSAFPPGFPAAVLVVQHFDAGQLESLREWLAAELKLPVRVALAGLAPQPGTIYLAGEGGHLELDAGQRFRLGPPERTDLHCPGVDQLFLSLVAQARPGVAVLLTGMGCDGARGLLELKRRGWATLVQDAASSAVDGMPRAARELDAATVVAPLAELAGRVLARLGVKEAA
jgi:chemotaxis response regulator CheB